MPFGRCAAASRMLNCGAFFARRATLVWTRSIPSSAPAPSTITTSGKITWAGTSTTTLARTKSAAWQSSSSFCNGTAAAPSSHPTSWRNTPNPPITLSGLGVQGQGEQPSARPVACGIPSLILLRVLQTLLQLFKPLVYVLLPLCKLFVIQHLLKLRGDLLVHRLELCKLLRD